MYITSNNLKKSDYFINTYPCMYIMNYKIKQMGLTHLTHTDMYIINECKMKHKKEIDISTQPNARM